MRQTPKLQKRGQRADPPHFGQKIKLIRHLQRWKRPNSVKQPEPTGNP